MSSGMLLGGGDEDPDLDLCPAGANVIYMFLTAWENGDYSIMYSLLDDASKKDYPFEEAEFDFRMLAFKPYKINSVRKKGEDFVFILSYGNWRDGDKDLRKMIISGRTYKLIMSTRKSIFEKSAADYF